MKTYYLAAIIVFVIGLAACSSSKKASGTAGNVWVNEEKIKDKSFQSVFIVAMTADIQARVQIENDLAGAAIAKGYKAVKSVDVIPSSLDDPKMPPVEEIDAKLKESGCDAIFIVSLLNKDESVRYVPGSTTYSQRPDYSFHGSYLGYYSNWYPAVSTPDYYAHNKSYFMESNLYDTASGDIMWSVQSEVFNPESIKKFSNEYTVTLIKLLEGNKVLQKRNSK